MKPRAVCLWPHPGVYFGQMICSKNPVTWSRVYWDTVWPCFDNWRNWVPRKRRKIPRPGSCFAKSSSLSQSVKPGKGTRTGIRVIFPTPQGGMIAASSGCAVYKVSILIKYSTCCHPHCPWTECGIYVPTNVWVLPLIFSPTRPNISIYEFEWSKFKSFEESVLQWR